MKTVFVLILLVIILPGCENPLSPPADTWTFPGVTVLGYKPYDGKGGAVTYRIDLRDSTDIPTTSCVFRNQDESVKFYHEYFERSENFYKESIPYSPGWTKLESAQDSVTLVLKWKADSREKKMAFSLWE